MFRQEISCGESIQWISVKLNFSVCYKIDSKQHWEQEKKNCIQEFWWHKEYHLVIDVSLLSKIQRYWKKKNLAIA